MGILSDVAEELLPELPRFFENYADDLDQLKQSLEDRDGEAMESTVHRMKGSSGSWGFQAIHETAVELERATKNRNWDAIEAELETLENEIERARNAVDEELNEQ